MKVSKITYLLILAFFSFSVFSQSQDSPNKKALEAMTRGDFQGAIRILDKDIIANKNLFQSYKFRADVKNMTGDFSGAFADLNSAIALKADEGALFQRRSQLRMILRQDMAEVLKDLDLAIANGVRSENVYSTRGMIRTNIGDIDGGISDYQLAIGLRPDFAQAHLGLSSAYRRKGDDDKATEILADFVASVENANQKTRPVKGTVTATSAVDIPSLSDDKTKTGQVAVIIQGMSRSGGPPTIEEMQRSGERMEQSKNTAAAYFNLASLYDQKAEYEKAFETVEKGLAVDPTGFYGYETRGRIRIGLKDYQGALIDLNKAIGMIQGIGGMYLNRGIAHLMLDKENEAERDFARFLELFPQGNPELERRKKMALEAREQK